MTNTSNITEIGAALKSAIDRRDEEKIEEILYIRHLPQLLDEAGCDNLLAYDVTAASKILYGNQVTVTSQLLDFFIQNKQEKMMFLLFKCSLTPSKVKKFIF